MVIVSCMLTLYDNSLWEGKLYLTIQIKKDMSNGDTDNPRSESIIEEHFFAAALIFLHKGKNKQVKTNNVMFRRFGDLVTPLSRNE